MYSIHTFFSRLDLLQYISNYFNHLTVLHRICPDLLTRSIDPLSHHCPLYIPRHCKYFLLLPIPKYQCFVCFIITAMWILKRNSRIYSPETARSMIIITLSLFPNLHRCFCFHLYNQVQYMYSLHSKLHVHFEKKNCFKLFFTLTFHVV